MKAVTPCDIPEDQIPRKVILFTPVRKVPSYMHQFSRNSEILNCIMWKYPESNFIQSRNVNSVM